jgi:hypothetical protein
MHASHLLTLLATTTLFALSSASPTTLHARAEKAVAVCADQLLANTPMCCNEAADGEDGLDCKEGEFRKKYNLFGGGMKGGLISDGNVSIATKIKTVKAFKKGCKKKQANCCATALGSGALVCQKVV